MGKLKRQRRKFHITSQTNKPENIRTWASCEEWVSQPLPLSNVSDKLFSGININFDDIKTDVADDVTSVKSFKSLKSEVSGNKSITKKEKLKLRHALFLKKIEIVQQKKKELKMQKNRKNIPVIGNMNALRDALPDLESLIKDKPHIKYTRPDHSTKQRGTEKSRKRKKKQITDFIVFKQILKNKDFSENPFGAIGNHINTVVKQECASIKK